LKFLNPFGLFMSEASINIHEIKTALKEIESKLSSLEEGLDIPTKSERLREIKEMEAEGSFWENPEESKKLQQEKKLLEGEVDTYQKLQSDLNDSLELLDMALDESSDEVLKEISEQLPEFQKAFEDLENKKMLSGEQDPSNAIVMVNSGAGGTESMDWAQMLYRMYTRWAERNGFAVKILDHVAGEEAGLKSVSFTVEGPYAYGYLKAEVGVHRLVRISPFDSNARRHTSFASVYVSPELDDDFEVEINDKDIRIDVFRAGGHGGQSVNTTDSAVRITHFPSGIVVSCQNERSQLKNKNIAMKVLKSRLYELHLEEERQKQEEVEAGKKKIDFGSQIRSYVLHPYKMVKDHRTNHESGNPDGVLDGDLTAFIRSYLLT
jgi:peptide chain release factor 2